MRPSILNNRPILITLISVLVLVSLIPLGVSTLNLSAFCLMFDRGLPYPFVISLALALEAFAILSSSITTLIGRAIGLWPAWMTASALLVWVGNAYVMWLAVPALPWFVPLCMASIAPMFTSGLGAGLGTLFACLGRVTREQTAAENSAIRRLTCGSGSELDG